MNKQCKKFFVDPILSEITFDSEQFWMLDLINTPEFQRLKRIKQLGNADLIFPSASHTRVAHSLGTFEIARRFLTSLGVLEKFRKESKVVLSAALLHDLGHGPHSHAFEKYTGVRHEEYTKKIILDHLSQINQILVANNVDPEEVVNVLFRKSTYPWMYDIIDSQIDSDRMDYLMRDSLLTNAAYGHLNSSVIIRNAKIIDNKVCFSYKSISEIVNLLIGRYHMYKQVYSHPDVIKNNFITTKIFSRVKFLYKNKYSFQNTNKLIDLFKPWLEDRNFTLDEFYRLDDSSFLTFIECLKLEEDSILKKLLIAYDNNSLVSITTVDKIDSSFERNFLQDFWNIESTIIYHSNKDRIFIYDEKLDVKELSIISPIISKLKDQKEEIIYFIKIN